jgi:hypothetical protein
MQRSFLGLEVGYSCIQIEADSQEGLRSESVVTRIAVSEPGVVQEGNQIVLVEVLVAEEEHN